MKWFKQHKATVFFILVLITIWAGISYAAYTISQSPLIQKIQREINEWIQEDEGTGK